MVCVKVEDSADLSPATRGRVIYPTKLFLWRGDGCILSLELLVYSVDSGSTKKVFGGHGEYRPNPGQAILGFTPPLRNCLQAVEGYLLWLVAWRGRSTFASVCPVGFHHHQVTAAAGVTLAAAASAAAAAAAVAAGVGVGPGVPGVGAGPGRAPPTAVITPAPVPVPVPTAPPPQAPAASRPVVGLSPGKQHPPVFYSVQHFVLVCRDDVIWRDVSVSLGHDVLTSIADSEPFGSNLNHQKQKRKSVWIFYCSAGILCIV